MPNYVSNPQREWLKPGNGDKVNARGRLRRYIAYHNFPKPPCEVCGAQKVEGHHEDYNKPFHVRWLCFVHHRMVHLGKLCLLHLEVVPVYRLVEEKRDREINQRWNARLANLGLPGVL